MPWIIFHDALFGIITFLNYHSHLKVIANLYEWIQGVFIWKGMYYFPYKIGLHGMTEFLLYKRNGEFQ